MLLLRCAQCVCIVDLFIGDDASPDASDAPSKTEALCLRILSSKTRFRFGGLQITVRSPAFEVGKIFNVTLDENNSIVGIDSMRDAPSSYESSPDGSSRSPTPSPRPGSRKISLVGALAPKPARIIINPSNENVSKCSIVRDLSPSHFPHLTHCVGCVYNVL